MANPPKRSLREGPYEIASLNQVFAISGVILLISVGLMVEDDYTREWKGLQDDFRDIEISRTEQALQQADAAIGEEAKQAAQEAITNAQIALQAQESVRSELADKLHLAEAVLKDITLKFGILKSKIDSRDYFISVAEHEGAPELEVLTTERARMSDELHQLAGDQEKAELAIAGIKREIADVDGSFNDAETALTALTFERDRIERSLNQLDLDLVTRSLLNAPLMDFVAPTQKVRQIVLPELKDDLYFAKVFKVDRCQTCHMAIDRGGFEHDTLRVDDQTWTGDIQERTAEHVTILPVGADSPVVVKTPADASVSVEVIDAVFRSHPNPELYLGATSKHPVNRFGCTVCHDGMGHAIDFSRVAHTPDLALPSSSDHAKEASAESHGGGHGEGSGWFERPSRQTWKDEHHWHQRHHWAYPMLPKTMIEARCLNCHEPDVPLPGANTLNAAREVLEKAACYGCHKIRGYEDAPKPAPPLTHIGDKLDRNWMHHWLKRPRDFRERTYMPRFFDLSNVDEVEGGHDFPAMQDVEVEAISEYLFEMSKSRWNEGDASYTKVEPGDAENGETLFETLGCVACHTSAAEEKPVEHQDFGPDLSRIADKLTRDEGRGAAWLYNWISDPKRHFADTTMPNLRLTEGEARDITAWLLERKQSDPSPRPELNPGVIDSMVVTYLEEKHTRADARAKADKLRAEGSEKKPYRAQLVYLGERTINRLGCFGCHDITGFEGRLGIGAELSTIGSKILSKFDFGHVEIQHTKHDWIAQKIDEPRIYDVTKVKAPGDKLKMPDFELESEEVGLLTTFLIGMVDDKIPESYKYRPGERTRARVAGNDLIQERNCVACHEFSMDEFELEMVDEDGAPSTHHFSGIQLLDTRPLAVMVDEDGEEERFETTVAFQLWSDIPGLDLQAGTALSIDIDDEGEVEVAGNSVTSYRLTRVNAGQGGVMASRVMRNWVLDSSDDELDLWDVVGSAQENELDADDVLGQAGAIKTSRSFVPPPLVGQGAKVQPGWLGDFLREPFTLRPQVQVRMPTFHLNESEVNTLVDYFQALSEEQQIETTQKDLLALQADVKGGAFKGRYASLEARITELLDAHDAHHFFSISFTESAIAWTINPALRRHGPLDEHLDTYYLDQEKQQAGWLSLGRELFEDPNINCASCHVRNGRNPGGEPKDWAPDLARARFRLQPAWIRQWITNPGRLLPDTNMPRLFPSDKQQYQDILEAHSSEQIEAVKDFLMSGLAAGVEVSPRKTRAGSQVTITSNSLDLDGIKSVTVGDRLVNEGSSQFVRIKGRGDRTTALQIRIPTAVSAGSVWLQATDGRFTASTRIEVTKTN